MRTLHHYDRIGLLRPARRAESGYRYYGRPELLRLQQILFYRELDFPLEQIRRILDDPDFDALGALRRHRIRIEAETHRLGRLLRTVDRTIADLQNQTEMVTEEEMYEGFTREQAAAYEREAKERWGADHVEQSKDRIRSMTREQWADFKAEGGKMVEELAALMDRPVTDEAVQALVARHHAQIEHFYPAPAEHYRGLGRMYTEDERFRIVYDRVKPGLADFLRRAMEHFADTRL